MIIKLIDLIGRVTCQWFRINAAIKSLLRQMCDEFYMQSIALVSHWDWEGLDLAIITKIRESGIYLGVDQSA